MYYKLVLEKREVLLLQQFSREYAIPIDEIILGLLMIGEARASETEWLEYTFFVPHRDGPRDREGVGLYADYRDLFLPVPRETATVIGTLLELHTKIKNRDWRLFNVLAAQVRT